jgi:hypothetical protein
VLAWNSWVQIILYLSLFFFFRTGVWTQGFVLTRQALYTAWATTLVHFALITLEMGLPNYLPGLALNFNLNLPRSQVYRHESLTLSYLSHLSSWNYRQISQCLAHRIFLQILVEINIEALCSNKITTEVRNRDMVYLLLYVLYLNRFTHPLT